MIRRRLGPGIAVAMALMSVLLAAQPVFAYEVVANVGKAGYTELSEPGGVCKYRTGGRLWFINVYKPSSAHGFYPTKTWVGFLIKIFRSTNGGTSWQEIYKSPVQKDKANDAIPADGFHNVKWYAPNMPSGLYKARVHNIFYDPPGSSVQVGRRVLEPDNYWFRQGNLQAMSPGDYCPANVV